VVDDDRAIRETMRVALEDEGYNVAEASDGAVALRRLRADAAPHVVLLDLRMPRVGGIEVLHEVAKDHDLLARNAFVLVTANLHTLDARALTFLDELSVATVAKPFELDDLLAEVASAAYRLAPRDAGGSSPAHPSSGDGHGL
jgi:two-component system response regulator MprA